MARTAVGIDDHNGWAIYVCVRLEPTLEVLQKGRFELTDGSAPTQPYHRETLETDVARGEAIVAHTARVACGCAMDGIGHVLDEISGSGRSELLAIRTAPLAPWPRDLAEIRADRASLPAADAMLYHAAITAAAEARGLRIAHFERATVVADAARCLGISENALARELEAQARPFGPPWRNDQLLAAAGAVLALGT